MVEHHEAAPGRDGGPQVGVGLVVAVHDHRGRIGAGGERGGQLALGGGVGAEPLASTSRSTATVTLALHANTARATPGYDSSACT